MNKQINQQKNIEIEIIEKISKLNLNLKQQVNQKQKNLGIKDESRFRNRVKTFTAEKLDSLPNSLYQTNSVFTHDSTRANTTLNLISNRPHIDQFNYSDRSKTPIIQSKRNQNQEMLLRNASPITTPKPFNLSSTRSNNVNNHLNYNNDIQIQQKLDENIQENLNVKNKICKLIQPNLKEKELKSDLNVRNQKLSEFHKFNSTFNHKGIQNQEKTLDLKNADDQSNRSSIFDINETNSDQSEEKIDYKVSIKDKFKKSIDQIENEIAKLKSISAKILNKFDQSNAVDHIENILVVYNLIKKNFQNITDKTILETKNQYELTLSNEQLKICDKIQKKISKNYLFEFENIFQNKTKQNELKQRFFYQDRGQKEYKFATQNSIQLGFCEFFPPFVSKKMLKIFKVSERDKFNDTQFKNFLRGILSLNMKEVFQFCFKVQNNEDSIEGIKISDLIEFYKHSQKSESKKEFMIDVVKMMRLQVNNITFQNNNKKIIVEKLEQGLLIDPKTKYMQFDERVFGEFIQNKIKSHQTKDSCINFIKFVLDIDWSEQFQVSTHKIQYPNIWDYIQQMLTNFTAKQMGSREMEKNLKMKNSMMRMQKLSLKESQDIQLVQCQSLGIQPEEDVKIFRLLRAWDKNEQILEFIKKNFYNISGLGNDILTFECLKSQISNKLNMYLVDKLCIQIWRILSPKGEPVNLFRFAFAIFKLIQDHIDVIFTFFDISNNGKISIYELEYFKCQFNWAPQLLVDIKLINEHLAQNGLENCDKSTFERVMCNYSRFGYWLLLLLQDSPDHRKFASEPDNLKNQREKEMKKEQVGFNFHHDPNDVYNYY